MALAETIPSKPERAERRTLPRALVIVGISLIAALSVGIFLLHRYWPFERASVVESLQEAGDSRVEIRSFRKTFFPNPGCTLEGVVFRHGSAATPLITIDRLIIQGTYMGIVARHVSRVTAEGMRIVIPAFGTSQTFYTSQSNVTVDELVANGTILEFASKDAGAPPLRFEIREALLQSVGWSGPLTYRVKIHNPEPPGEITANGKFGVWNESAPEETPLSGDYKFEHADLSVYRGISGMLSSEGKFSGKLGHIDVSGATDTPDFEVDGSGHPVHLATEFKANVDGTNGDTNLDRVDAHFRRTHVIAHGSVAKTAHGEGKTARIDLNATHGRIEDILSLFVSKNPAPMSGDVSLHAHVELPPGERSFLQKVTLKGGFGIEGGGFSDASTQQGVNKLSAGALGEKDTSNPETALTDLKGEVVLREGVGTFSDLSFGVPGAAARMHGTYNIINHKVDLHGQMQVDTKISKTTSGTKAFLLTLMDPIFKKKKKGEIVPVRISGTYENPSFALDLDDKKAQVVSPPSPKESASAPAHH